jgi:hypothetical protein
MTALQHLGKFRKYSQFSTWLFRQVSARSKK